MISAVEEWIIGWLEKNTALLREEIIGELEENYFQKGWIDSFQLINFISEIENAFGMRFSNDDFQDRSFSTVKGLASIINKKKLPGE